MRESDEKTLRQVLREAVAASGRTKRALEDLLGVGHGNLDKLLTGVLEIRVRHLTALADLLGVPAADFLTLGFPQQAAAARRRLTDWIAPENRSHEERVAALAGLPASRAELAEVVRAAVREELERRNEQAPSARAAKARRRPAARRGDGAGR